MAREEEEEEEAMSLTYDRPELVNKVVFRRSLSTGNWEVCLCDQASQNKVTTTSHKIQSNSKVKNSHKNKAKKQYKKASSEELPLSLTPPNSTNTLSGITKDGLSGKRSNDPDYTPGPDVTTRKTRSSPRNTSISPKSESIKSKIKNSTLHTTSNCENVLVNSSSTESISSRTRHRQNQSNTSVLVNHSNDNDITPRRQSLRRKH